MVDWSKIIVGQKILGQFFNDFWPNILLVKNYFGRKLGRSEKVINFITVFGKFFL